MNVSRCVPVVAAVLASVLAAGTPVRAGDNPILVSSNQSGTAAGDWVYFVSLSSTGRYVTFDSEGVGLVAGADTQMRRIYLRDVLLGQTELCSVNSAGEPASDSADHPAMSADARYVLFHSSAPNLPPGGQYVRDRALLTTIPVSKGSHKPQLSDDGQWIFSAGGQARVDHITSGEFEILSVSDEGEEANAQVFLDTLQCVSADMRFVVFDTQASNLVDAPTGGQLQVYVRDRLLRTTRLVSATPAGEAADGSSMGESISADGRLVAFSSYAKNLAGLDRDSKPQTYVRDLLTGTLELVSVNNAGEPSTNDNVFFTTAYTTSLSGDGRLVAFAIATSNLVPGIAGTNVIVAVRDRLAGLTYAVSVDQQGHDASGIEPMISRSGRAVVFISNGACVPQDTNGNATDCYVYDRLPWTEIEPGLTGSLGVPRLVMQGAPAAQAPIMMALTRALPGSLAQLVIGFGQVNLPFKGGVMVPVPAVLLPLPTNAQGMLVLKVHWPAGVPAGTPLCLQAWIPDAAGPAGFAATNGVANIAQ